MIPLFMLSRGRSGSTLMQRLLNLHPSVFFYGEHNGYLKPICDSIALLDFNDNLSETHGRMIKKKCDTSRTFIAWARPFKRDDYIAGLRSFISHLYKVDELPEDAVWGFKEVRYDADVAKALSVIFPECRFIVIQRNFFEFFLSWTRAFIEDDIGYSTFKEVAGSYAATYDGLLALKASCGTERVIHIRYEALSQSVWPTMQGVFRWLNLPVEDGLRARIVETGGIVVDYLEPATALPVEEAAGWLARLLSEERELGDRLRRLCPELSER